MITVRLSKEMEERLRRLSESTRRPKSYYVREALERYIEEMEDVYVAVERLAEPSRRYGSEEVKKKLGL